MGSMTTQERRNTQLKLDFFFWSFNIWRLQEQGTQQRQWLHILSLGHLCSEVSDLIIPEESFHEKNCNGFKNTPAFKAIYVFNSLNACITIILF